MSSSPPCISMNDSRHGDPFLLNASRQQNLVDQLTLSTACMLPPRRRIPPSLAMLPIFHRHGNVGEDLVGVVVVAIPLWCRVLLVGSWVPPTYPAIRSVAHKAQSL